MVCVSCGYSRKKYLICSRCGKHVCYMCMQDGKCKDCFVIAECAQWDPEYLYKEKGVVYEYV